MSDMGDRQEEEQMIRTGDLIANPLTGETVTFQKTAADSGGEVVIAQVTLEPAKKPFSKNYLS